MARTWKLGGKNFLICFAEEPDRGARHIDRNVLWATSQEVISIRAVEANGSFWWSGPCISFTVIVKL